MINLVDTSLRDGIDTITDFTPGVDSIDLGAVMQSLGIVSATPLSSGYVTCKQAGTDASVGIDPDAGGPAISRNLIRVKQVSCSNLLNSANFKF